MPNIARGYIVNPTQITLQTTKIILDLFHSYDMLVETIGDKPMKKKIRTMQIVDKNTSQIIPRFIDTSQPLQKIEEKLKGILKNTRVDEWSEFKLIVTRVDSGTIFCIFVDEHDKGNIYHFGCFDRYHPARYSINKTYKTLKGAMRYFPQFVS